MLLDRLPERAALSQLLDATRAGRNCSQASEALSYQDVEHRQVDWPVWRWPPGRARQGDHGAHSAAVGLRWPASMSTDSNSVAKLD